MGPPAVRAENLTKRYRKVEALRGLSFEVAAGEVFGLVGADGAGKSTTLLILAGLLKAQGRAEVAAIDVLRHPERVRGAVGFMPQGLGQNLSPELTVEENIGFFADLHGAPKGECVERRERLLSATRLAAFRHRQARHLSGGMKQKLALCCTLISEPQILILDEPTTGVDPVSRREFWTILEQVRAQGMTVVLATAYMDEADRCDRVGLLHEGRLLSVGPPQELRAQVPGRLVEMAAAPQAEAVRVLAQAGLGPEVMGESVRFVADEGGREAALRLLEGAGVSVSRLRVREPSFEHAFIHAVGARPAGLGAGAGLSPQPDEAGCGEEASAAAGAADEHPVVVAGLIKRFGEFAAVDGISFEVRRGEVFGFLGSNGAGKTTTIKILCGLGAPTAGTVRVLGHEPLREPHRLKAQMGYVSQRFSLYRDLTALENLALYGGMYGLPRRLLAERARWALKLAELEGKESVLTGELPLGMKQRLALGCALVHRPRLLFLDEPTAGVDPLARRVFWGLIHHLSRERGVTVLVTTHYMDEAEHCDRIGLIHAGRFVALGSPAQLKAEVAEARGSLMSVRCARPAAALELVRAELPEAYLCARRLQFFSRRPEADLARVRALLGPEFEEAAHEPVTLDDVFVHFIQAAEAGGAPLRQGMALDPCPPRCTGGGASDAGWRGAARPGVAGPRVSLKCPGARGSAPAPSSPRCTGEGDDQVIRRGGVRPRKGSGLGLPGCPGGNAAGCAGPQWGPEPPPAPQGAGTRPVRPRKRSGLEPPGCPGGNAAGCAGPQWGPEPPPAPQGAGARPVRPRTPARRLIGAIARREVREMARSRRFLTLAIGVPLFLFFLFAYALFPEVRNISLVVLDEDRTPASRDFVEAFRGSGYFRLQPPARSLQDVQNRLDAGQVRSGLVIPARFAEALSRGERVSVQALIDGSIPARASVVEGYLEGVSASFSRRSLERHLGSRLGLPPEAAAPVVVEERIWFNPTLSSMHFVVPALLAIILMFYPVMLSTLAVTREKESGAILNIHSSPVRGWHYYVGKLAPYALFSLALYLVMFALAVFWFGAPFRGGFLFLTLATALYILSTVGLGIVCALALKTQAAAVVAAALLTIVPSFTFSGFFMPVELMADSIRTQSHLFPVMYYMTLVRAVFLKGSGPELLWREVGFLVLYGLLVFGASLLLFRKRG